VPMRVAGMVVVAVIVVVMVGHGWAGNGETDSA
jgi:hypothetical protein